MKKIRALFRKWAARLVAYYYNKLYRRAVLKAEQLHEERHTTIYVIEDFLKGERLSCIDRKGFRWIKHHAQHLLRDRRYWSAEYGTPMLRKTAWYHTADGSEKGGLTPGQVEIRRLAFIRKGLKKARLY